MEDNRPFMPPPPPKMPPPPRVGASGQTQQQSQMPESDMQTGQTADENVKVVEEQTRNSNDFAKVDGAVQSELQSKVESVAEKKQSKTRKKPSLATMLYWIGFVLCVAGIALSIYFLVK